MLTTLPHRYHSFGAEAPRREDLPGLTIRRIALGRHRSGMLDQSLLFARFALGARETVRGERYDLVFATSSRLGTALLGAHLARRAGARLYLDIRDLFVDNMKEVLRGPAAALANRALPVLERYALTRAATVNVVSGGFLDYLRRRYPRQRLVNFSNGIDEEFLAAAPAARRPSPRPAGPGTLTVVYAGNIGEGQGLEQLVPPLAERLGPRVQFRIIGDGGRRAQLEASLEARGLSNVTVLDPVGRGQLIEEYRRADVLLLHLNAYQAFEKVLPSKVFEYAAMGKPLWAGVGGFAADFLRAEVDNVALFRPCDPADAARALNTLVLEDAPRALFTAKFRRDAITAALADDILAVAAAP